MQFRFCSCGFSVISLQLLLWSINNGIRYLGLFLCLLIRFITPLIRYLDAALSSMNQETISATRIYSKNLLKTFKSIYFPALYPSLLLGFLVVFIEVIKEQPATLLLRPVGSIHCLQKFIILPQRVSGNCRNS